MSGLVIMTDLMKSAQVCLWLEVLSIRQHLEMQTSSIEHQTMHSVLTCHQQLVSMSDLLLQV